MNDNHTRYVSNYKQRLITEQLSSAIKDHPAVVLTGARQVGKSTILLRDPLFKGWQYYTFDDFSLVSQANEDPSSLWLGKSNVILDEVQKVPALLSAIKQSIDKARGETRFVLSGSANLLLMHQIEESLAGRAVFFQLYPMTCGEMACTSRGNILKELLSGKIPEQTTVMPRSDMFALMLQGFMPPLMTLSSDEARLRWWEGYIATYLERDLRQLSQIDSMSDFRNVMTATALRSGQLLNQTEISRDLKITQPKVFRYLNLLEVSCLLKRVPAYTKSRTKRLVKAPKAYFIDPALTSYLCGYFDKEQLKSAREVGQIFESLVLLHLMVHSEQMVPSARIFYWRTVTGKEVDFVIEYGNKLLPIEVKLSSKADYSDTGGLRAFMEEYPNVSHGIIIYTGHECKRITEKITALPVSCLF